MSEYDEKIGDEMVDQVEKRVQSHTTDQYDDNTLAHTPTSIIHREEPSRLDVLKPAATAQIVEMGRAKLVCIEKPKTSSSEEDIHTVTRIHIQKNIHKPKVLNLREKGKVGQSQGKCGPERSDGGITRGSE